MFNTTTLPAFRARTTVYRPPSRPDDGDNDQSPKIRITTHRPGLCEVRIQTHGQLGRSGRGKDCLARPAVELTPEQIDGLIEALKVASLAARISRGKLSTAGYRAWNLHNAKEMLEAAIVRIQHAIGMETRGGGHDDELSYVVAGLITHASAVNRIRSECEA